jgi:hypothetical protein
LKEEGLYQFVPPPRLLLLREKIVDRRRCLNVELQAGVMAPGVGFEPTRPARTTG